jgi:hypothetical protein
MNAATLLMLLILSGLSGCASLGVASDATASHALAGKIDVKACRDRGGKVENVCKLQVPACVTPFPDAGRRCTDNSQCQGKCILDIDHRPESDDEVSGRCEVDDNPCGCKIEVVNGRIGEEGRCVD